MMALLAMPVIFGYTFFRQWEVFDEAKQVISIGFQRTVRLTLEGETSFFMIPKKIPAFLQYFDAYTPLIFLVYFSGMILFSLSGMAGYIKLYIYRNHYSVPLAEKCVSRVADLVYEAGLNRKVKLFVSSRISIPCVAGFIKPVIMLPVILFTTLTPEQIETIFLHEFRHIRRLDHYINMLQNILEILFFFHPAVWWISNRLRNEIENCVDEWVVKTTGKPRMYAEALLLLEAEKRKPLLQPAIAAVSSKNQLFSRIKNIMTMKTRKINAGQKIATVLLVVASVASLAWINPAFITMIPSNSDSVPVYSAEPDSGLNHISKPVPDTTGKKEPDSIYLQDGTVLLWKNLDEKDRQEIYKTIEEAHMDISEANRELMDYYRSEEFQEQIRKTRAEVSEALEKARYEMLKIQSEEFSQEMQKAHKEFRNAMEQLDKEELRRVNQEIDKAVQEVAKIDWIEINREISGALKEVSDSLEEVGKVLREIGPILNETLQSVDIEKIMEEVNRSLKEINLELEELKKQKDK